MRRCLLVLIVVPLLCGCGRSASTDVRGDVLTVYSASPLTGRLAPQGRSTVTGEKLALGLAHGTAGGLLVRFVSLDSARGAASGFDPDVVTNNAQDAVDDSSAIAYLGDSAPRATRLALPILSAASIAALSPSDPDPTLTAPRRVIADAYTRPLRTGYSLGSLTDAQILALAGPRFPAAYRKAFGGRPDAATARGYVSMQLLLAAIRAAGAKSGDRQGVATALGPVVEGALARARS